MKRFKTYLTERFGHGAWVKGTALMLMGQVKGLSNKIESEKDEATRSRLIARQNNLIAYMVTLGIAIDIKDKSLLNRAKKT